MRTSCLTLVLVTATSLFSLGDDKVQQTTLTNTDKGVLLNLARQTLYWYLKDGTLPTPDKAALGEALLQKRACFVTLDKKGRGLRGCIGLFERERPLYVNVIDRAVAAATQDPRFPRVRYEELKDIKIDISVLTEPHDLPFTSPDDLLAKLRPLRDGVILKTRYGGSTFLPQVWEQLPDKEQFLSHLCRKHGAPGDAWRQDYKQVTVSIYEAVVFGEEVYGRKVIGRHGGTVGEKGASVLGATDITVDGFQRGGTPVAAGTTLAPGTVVAPDADVSDAAE